MVIDLITPRLGGTEPPYISSDGKRLLYEWKAPSGHEKGACRLEVFQSLRLCRTAETHLNCLKTCGGLF